MDAANGRLVSTTEETVSAGGNVAGVSKAIEVIKRQTDFLKRVASVPLAIHLLEMALLELSLHVNHISAEELDSFCHEIREAMSNASIPGHPL